MNNTLEGRVRQLEVTLQEARGLIATLEEEVEKGKRQVNTLANKVKMLERQLERAEKTSTKRDETPAERIRRKLAHRRFKGEAP